MVASLKKSLLFFLLTALLCASSFAQVKNRGIPHIINYPKKTYSAGPQNWAITQDHRGFIYAGNNDGILEFDGKRWKRYSLPDRFMYRAVAVAADGTLYVGLSNEFGFMKPDENGLLAFESISARFPKIAANFNDIWKIYDTPDGIYFQAKNKIFRYHNDQLEAISPEREFNFLFKANKMLYCWERHRGLILVNESRTLPAPGGEFFIGKSIESVISYDENRVIIGTAKNGLYLYDGRTATRWASKVSGFLEESSVFCGTQINNRYFAFGTIRDGVLILDRNGTPVQHINQSKGLQNNTVLSIFTDRDNNLWLGLDQGVSFIEINSPITYYGYGKSLPGTGYTSIHANGLIYAGTNQGLFVRPWTPYEDPLSTSDQFRLVPGTQGQVWSLTEIDNTLFCGHNSGTFRINGNKAELISEVAGGWGYRQLNTSPPVIIGGTYTGILPFEKNGQQWKPRNMLSGFNESSRFFAEDADGSLWVAHGDLGIFRMVPNESFTGVEKVRMYNESDGLPSRYRNSLFKIKNQILFTTISGIYRYNRKTDTFEPDARYAALLGEELVNSLSEDPEGNIWFFKPDEIGVIRTEGGEAKSVEKRPFYPITSLLKGNFEQVNVIDDANIIFASEEGFVHYDPTFPVKYPESGKCYIRSLTGSGEATRIFFGGISPNHKTGKEEAGGDESAIRIPFGSNNLRFEFSAPIFDNPEEVRFSYFLEGIDRSRSDWSAESSKDYTALHEGTYLFRVKARSIYNIETEDAVIRFRILPPWYRSLAASIVYILIFLTAAGFAVRRILDRIRHDKLNLSKKHEHDLELVRQQNIAQSLESEMLHKNKQLASSISGLLRKNEFLIQLKEEISRISEKEPDPRTGDKLRKIMARVDETIEADHDDEQFEDHFDAVHDNFLKTIKKQYPQLTPQDLRLCAYLRMNLTTKEIAPLLNISPRGVEISRYRLRKKMNLPHDANLIDFMLKI